MRRGKNVDAIENICRTHDIRDVISMPANKKVILCPLPQHVHHKNTPSFSIFWREGKQWWRCHGSCNMEGDVVDLVGFLRMAGYKRYTLTDRLQAAQILDNNFRVTVLIPQPENRLAGDEWLQFLPATVDALAYARKRGLTRETVERFRFGAFGDFLTMPCFEESLLTGIKLRNTNPSSAKGRFWSWPGSKAGLFNADSVRYKAGVVFVVKGEIPAALMHQMGYQVCAPTSGEGGWNDKWRTALALSRRVVIGDNDAPGKILAAKRGLLLGAEVVFPPERFKDWDEWYLADPEGCIRATDEWKEKFKPDW